MTIRDSSLWIRASSLYIILAAIFALIPIGVFLGFYFDNPVWFLVAIAAFIFFMAG